MFRGREQSRPELGFRLLQKLADDVQELGFVESQAKQDGRNMIMVIGPHRKPVSRTGSGSHGDHGDHGDAEPEPATQSRPVPSPRSQAPSESAAQTAAGAAVDAPASTDA